MFNYFNSLLLLCIAQKMKFSIKDFFSKCDQIYRKLPVWSHLLKKSLMENYTFCVVMDTYYVQTYLILFKGNSYQDNDICQD